MSGADATQVVGHNMIQPCSKGNLEGRNDKKGSRIHRIHLARWTEYL